MLTGAVMISLIVLASEASLPCSTDVLSFGTSVLLVIAVSLDSIGAGLAYGARGTRITAPSGIIIALCTAVMMCVSMTAGNFLAEALPFKGTKTLGGIILIAIGCWQFLQGWRNYINHFSDGDSSRPLLHLRIPFLGVVMQILRDPNLADANWSGTIDPKESILLGSALGLDAFSAGFGAALSGFSLWIVPFVATACVVFVFIGSSFGSRFMAHRLKQGGFILPGIFLIAIGIWQML
jgi:putative sporulation protein YtaF